MRNHMPTWQTTPCPAWCKMTHTDGDFPDDRVHRPSHELAAVLLTANDPVHDQNSEPPILAVDLEQHAGETGPRILLGKKHSPGFSLTPPEAVLLGRALLAAGQLAGMPT